MYIAKINNDLYLKKAVEEKYWSGSQKINYKLTNSLKQAVMFETIDKDDSIIKNLILYGFKFFKLEEVEMD